MVIKWTLGLLMGQFCQTLEINAGFRQNHPKSWSLDGGTLPTAVNRTLLWNAWSVVTWPHLSELQIQVIRRVWQSSKWSLSWGLLALLWEESSPSFKMKKSFQNSWHCEPLWRDLLCHLRDFFYLWTFGQDSHQMAKSFRIQLAGREAVETPEDIYVGKRKMCCILFANLPQWEGAHGSDTDSGHLRISWETPTGGQLRRGVRRVWPKK